MKAVEFLAQLSSNKKPFMNKKLFQSNANEHPQSMLHSQQILTSWGGPGALYREVRVFNMLGARPCGGRGGGEPAPSTVSMYWERALYRKGGQNDSPSPMDRITNRHN